MDETRILPAGNPFYAEAHRHDPEPHGCYEGFVYVGHLDDDPETSEEVEEIEIVEARPCRRCGGA